MINSYLKYTKKGIYCIPGKFYLDPLKRVDLAIISHGHADHARPGMKHYLCHHYTKPVLQHRISSDISVVGKEYGEVTDINGVKVSLHPAGHLIGSSQIRMEYKGEIAVFSGDYKVDHDGLSTPFEPVRCHTFITESTFGLPIYRWESRETLNDKIKQWVNQNQANGSTSIFLGYSLGKAQRIMKLVEGLGEMYVHTAIENVNQAIESAGIVLPDRKVMDIQKRQEMKGKIVVVPPSLFGTEMIEEIPNGRTAMCSGWMQVRGNWRWRAVDAGFVVSDHADWGGLLSAIKATEAEKVFVTHGYETVLAKYLNETGIEAYELRTGYGGTNKDSRDQKKKDQA